MDTATAGRWKDPTFALVHFTSIILAEMHAPRERWDSNLVHYVVTRYRKPVLWGTRSFEEVRVSFALHVMQSKKKRNKDDVIKPTLDTELTQSLTLKGRKECNRLRIGRWHHSERDEDFYLNAIARILFMPGTFEMSRTHLYSAVATEVFVPLDRDIKKYRFSKSAIRKSFKEAEAWLDKRTMAGPPPQLYHDYPQDRDQYKQWRRGDTYRSMIAIGFEDDKNNWRLDYNALDEEGNLLMIRIQPVTINMIFCHPYSKPDTSSLEVYLPAAREALSREEEGGKPKEPASGAGGPSD